MYVVLGTFTLHKRVHVNPQWKKGFVLTLLDRLFALL